MDQLTIQKIIQLKSSDALEPYVRYIRFPHYKNLKHLTQIDFSFPITALVGTNGTNKSTILKALCATQSGVSLGSLWFSTIIDPIRHDPVPSYIYGYLHKETNTEAEILITKYYRKDDPDYWEAARPVKKYHMKGMPTDSNVLSKLRNKTRWEKIEKECLYLTFRDSISAFEKFYYYGDSRSNGADINLRKKAIRRNSLPLKVAIEKKLKTHIFNRVERITGENTIIEQNIINKISEILGVKYSEISIIKHKYFYSEGYTCKIKKMDMDYSEAFAGSGEFAVIKMVYQIMKAPNKSLIVLDEPEVSLHPGAQTKLVEFLYKMVLEKKHQFVIATHSPAIVRELPSDAIKVLTVNSLTNEVELLKQSCDPYEVFYHIGEPSNNKKTLIVEDQLAKKFIEHSIKNESDAFRNQLDIKHYNGGAFDIYNKFAVAYALSENKNVYLYLDGDQRPRAEDNLPKLEDIPPAQDNELEKMIKNFCGGAITFPFNSNTSITEKVATYRKFIKWLNTQVFFMDGCSTPEEILWNFVSGEDLIGIDGNLKAKEKFSALAQKRLGTSEDISSNTILTYQREFLAKIPQTDNVIQKINQDLNLIISL